MIANLEVVELLEMVTYIFGVEETVQYCNEHYARFCANPAASITYLRNSTSVADPFHSDPVPRT